MNENIDLTKILKGCPKGTIFYSSVHGKLAYLSMYVSSSASTISFEVVNSCSIIDGRPVTIQYYRDGRIYPNSGECTVFPSKYQRDWSKFVRFWDKPKVEKFDPKTLQPFDKVLVKRCGLEDKWMCNIFSFYDEGTGHDFECLDDVYENCIPYNDETKRLIGTTDDCPEYYKWWEE